MATTTVDLGSVIGPQGEKGVNYKGSLNLQNTYVKDDLISYGGSTYIVIANSVKGVVPPNNSYYRVFAEKGDPGEDGAVAITELSPGMFALSVNAEGHLILTHNDNEPAPPLSIQDGKLIYTIS